MGGYILCHFIVDDTSVVNEDFTDVKEVFTDVFAKKFGENSFKITNINIIQLESDVEARIYPEYIISEEKARKARVGSNDSDEFQKTLNEKLEDTPINFVSRVHRA